MNYKQLFKDHIIHQTLVELNDLIDKITWDVPEYKNSDELLKLKYSFEYVKKCIISANVYITNITTFDNINASLNNVKAYITAFLQETSNGLEKALLSIDGALSYSNSIVQKANAIKNVIEIDSVDIFQKLQKSMESSIKFYDKKLEDFDLKSQELIKNVDIATQNLEVTKQRVESFLINLQTSYNSSEKNREAEFEELLDKFLDDIKKQLSQQTDDYEQQKESFLGDSKDLIVEMSNKRDEASKLLQIIATTGFAGNYSKNADYERKSANIMRLLSLITFSIISGFAIWILFSFQTNGDDWKNTLIKILATTLLSGLATYTTRESSKHRKLEQKYRKMELELSSIDAFIENLPETKRNNLKIEITRNLFSNTIEESKIDFKNEENEFTISTSLLQNLVRIIEDTMKNLSKKAT